MMQTATLMALVGVLAADANGMGGPRNNGGQVRSVAPGQHAEQWCEWAVAAGSGVSREPKALQTPRPRQSARIMSLPPHQMSHQPKGPSFPPRVSGMPQDHRKPGAHRRAMEQLPWNEQRMNVMSPLPGRRPGQPPFFRHHFEDSSLPPVEPPMEPRHSGFAFWDLLPWTRQSPGEHREPPRHSAHPPVPREDFEDMKPLPIFGDKDGVDGEDLDFDRQLPKPRPRQHRPVSGDDSDEPEPVFKDEEVADARPDHDDTLLLIAQQLDDISGPPSEHSGFSIWDFLPWAHHSPADHAPELHQFRPPRPAGQHREPPAFSARPEDGERHAFHREASVAPLRRGGFLQSGKPWEPLPFPLHKPSPSDVSLPKEDGKPAPLHSGPHPFPGQTSPMPRPIPGDDIPEIHSPPVDNASAPQGTPRNNRGRP